MGGAQAPASCQQENFGVVQAFSQQILHHLLDDQRAHEGVATYTHTRIHTEHKESVAGERPLNEEVRGFTFALGGLLLCSDLGVAPLHTSLEQYGMNLHVENNNATCVSRD